MMAKYLNSPIQMLLTIMVCMVIYADTQVVAATRYCPLDLASNQRSADGFPLPVPLPQDSRPDDSLDNEEQFYECPSNTQCCAGNQCCTVSGQDEPRPFYKQLDYRLCALSIAACIVVSVVLLICCFWSPCCLYNACQKDYSRDAAGCADKALFYSPAGPMPREDTPLRNTFLINHFFQRVQQPQQQQEVCV